MTAHAVTVSVHQSRGEQNTRSYTAHYGAEHACMDHSLGGPLCAGAAQGLRGPGLAMWFLYEDLIQVSAQLTDSGSGSGSKRAAAAGKLRLGCRTRRDGRSDSEVPASSAAHE
eukprot:2887958-Rhodomonas_salina.1